MYWGFLIFFTACVVVVSAEAVCFARIRNNYPKLFVALGKPKVFFHGMSSNALCYFVTLRYWTDSGLKAERLVFALLSISYLFALTCFLVLIWQQIQIG